MYVCVGELCLSVGVCVGGGMVECVWGVVGCTRVGELI